MHGRKTKKEIGLSEAISSSENKVESKQTYSSGITLRISAVCHERPRREKKYKTGRQSLGEVASIAKVVETRRDDEMQLKRSVDTEDEVKHKLPEV